MDSLEHKTIPSGGVQPTGEEGVVEALVSVTGIKDNVGDIIVPGAYAKTLAERTPKGVWSHDWNSPVSKVLDIKELMPGDPQLPKTLSNGDPWPAEAGGLYVKTQFNLNTQAGRDAYENVIFFGDTAEWSIGYKVPKGQATVDKTGVRHIKSLNLYEFSPVLFGAASEARSLVTSIKGLFADEDEWKKAVSEALDNEEKSDEPSDEELISALMSNDEAKTDEDTDDTMDEPKTEERSESREVKLNPVVIERLKTLQDEIKAVLDVALGVEDNTVEIDIPTKSLDEAMEDILNSDIDIDRKTIVGVVKLGRVTDETERKELAIKVLDDIDAALNDADADQELLLKTLAKAIGNSLDVKSEDEAPVVEDEEEKAVEPEVEETKTITIDEADYKALFGF
jgi:phage head maturation protease